MLMLCRMDALVMSVMGGKDVSNYVLSYKKGGDRIFSRVCCDRRGNSSKPKEGKYTLDTRKKFLQ